MTREKSKPPALPSLQTGARCHDYTPGDDVNVRPGTYVCGGRQVAHRHARKY